MKNNPSDTAVNVLLFLLGVLILVLSSGDLLQ